MSFWPYNTWAVWQMAAHTELATIKWFWKHGFVTLFSLIKFSSLVDHGLYNLLSPGYWLLLFPMFCCQLWAEFSRVSYFVDSLYLTGYTFGLTPYYSQLSKICQQSNTFRINLPLFSTVLPSNSRLFLFCRPFFVITTFSTGLVDVEVTSVSGLGQLTVGV